MTLTGTGNKCPVCGKEFFPTPPITPNLKEKEFYGGRVSFFKTVDCDCTAKYRLCIDKKYDNKEGRDVFRVIDMEVLQEGIPLDELAVENRVREELQGNDTPTRESAVSITEKLATKDALKKQAVLATIVDLDTKIETLCYHTVAELKTMCKRRKLRYTNRDSKAELARTLLAYDPSLVRPNPED